MSACTKFNINNLRNGWVSLNYIEAHLKILDESVKTMLVHHKCNYCVGALVRIRANKCSKEYRNDCCIWKKYLKAHTWKLLLKREVSLYRKVLFVSVSVPPGGGCRHGIRCIHGSEEGVEPSVNSFGSGQ